VGELASPVLNHPKQVTLGLALLLLAVLMEVTATLHLLRTNHSPPMSIKVLMEATKNLQLLWAIHLPSISMPVLAHPPVEIPVLDLLTQDLLLNDSVPDPVNLVSPAPVHYMQVTRELGLPMQNLSLHDGAPYPLMSKTPALALLMLVVLREVSSTLYLLLDQFSLNSPTLASPVLAHSTLALPPLAHPPVGIPALGHRDSQPSLRSRPKQSLLVGKCVIPFLKYGMRQTKVLDPPVKTCSF